MGGERGEGGDLAHFPQCSGWVTGGGEGGACRDPRPSDNLYGLTALGAGVGGGARVGAGVGAGGGLGMGDEGLGRLIR
jgi:hypothetical protein